MRKKNDDKKREIKKKCLMCCRRKQLMEKGDGSRDYVGVICGRLNLKGITYCLFTNRIN